MSRKITLLIGLLNLFAFVNVKATEKNDSLKMNFENAFRELKSMLEEKQTPNFEKAIFISENAYWDNEYTFSDFQTIISNHLFYINKLIIANDKSCNMDFDTKVNENGRFKIEELKYTPKEKQKLYNRTLKNWAIFTYLSDTTIIHSINDSILYSYYHYPFKYASNDPFGIKEWKNSQILNILVSKEHNGNCFALTGLYKIFADRLNTGAKICTAPQHIYIQHQDEKGDFYNVELATAGHPGDGVIQTLTYTTNEAIMNGISLRSYNDKESIGLCLVNLAKGYEHRFKTDNEAFILKCAELALRYDPLNLNALLLKQQVLDKIVIDYAVKNNLKKANELKKDSYIFTTITTLENQISKLYNLGYRQMPVEMQKEILNDPSNEANIPIFKEQNAKPFTTVKTKEKKDADYMTLSQGTFKEVFDNNDLETYGHFIYSTKTKTIVGIDTNYKDCIIDPVAFAYNFGARMYDARIGRFISLDPLAAKYPQWSPYSAFANNPVFYTDPDGREVKPANGDAVTQLNNVFSSFDSKSGKSGADLFGLESRPVSFENAPQQLVFSTSLTQKQFSKNLKNSHLSESQKKEAEAIFKVLSSNDIYEIGTVQTTSGINNNVTTSADDKPVDKVRFVSNNTDAISLLNKTEKGLINNSQIQGALKAQENSGSTPNGGAYGLFPDYYKAQSEDKYINGVILINPAQSSDGTRSSGQTNSQETQSIIEGIQGAAEKIAP